MTKLVYVVFAPVQVPAYLCGSNAVVMDYLLDVAVVMDHFSSSGSSDGSCCDNVAYLCSSSAVITVVMDNLVRR